MSNWWDAEPDERLWIEITRRRDIGSDLKAPVAARGGGVTPGYALVPLVRGGDLVVHYQSDLEQIVGVSVVTGDPEPAPIFWVARGTYARRAGARPAWLPGIRVPLANFTPVDPAVTLDDIRRHEAGVLGLRAQLKAAHPHAPLYFPWIPYRGQPMRTWQTYLAKLPRAFLRIFPQLLLATDLASDRFAGPLGELDEVGLAESATESAAARTQLRRGQGYLTDQQVKVAVEALAMNAAADYYADSWSVEDVHGSESYDLRCRRDDIEKHVEVKGTTTLGAAVLLTPNEVQHARIYPEVALFILASIKVAREWGGNITASGGTRIIFDPWNVDAGNLMPVGYRYSVPATS